MVITIDLDAKLYINGILDAVISGSDFTLPDDIYATSTNLGLWLQDVRYSGVMDGNLDDIRFYNRALNSAEIQALYKENNISIVTPDLSVYRNSSFEIPIYAKNLQEGDNNISYQFDFNFNPEKILYQNYSVEGTLSSESNIQVNMSEYKLSVAWAGQTPLADSGILIKLRFIALETGIITPVLSKFLINTDTIRSITNGTLTINPCYGDVDANRFVQAYDAALTLQYSVGLDPLPDIDPLPWEVWRIIAANVDGQDDISAYDASLILQYTVGLINSFPMQDLKKSTDSPQADISVSNEDGYIIFRSTGDLYGLNVSVNGNSELLGIPQVFNTNALLATNITSSGYSIGLATANAPVENEAILKIPIIKTPIQPVTLNLIINNKVKLIDLGLPTGISDLLSKSIEIYPNPANTILYFRNLVGETSISIYDLQGRKVMTGKITNNQVDISYLDYGLYTFHIQDSKSIKTVKLLKQ